jgi:hypothetical protein
MTDNSFVSTLNNKSKQVYRHRFIVNAFNFQRTFFLSMKIINLLNSFSCKVRRIFPWQILLYVFTINYYLMHRTNVMFESVLFLYFIQSIIRRTSKICFKKWFSLSMFQIFGRKFRSNQCEHLNPIVKGITDVQIFFFTIHGKSHWRIEMICIDAIVTITITLKKMKISECNSWIFFLRENFCLFTVTYLKNHNGQRFAFAIRTSLSPTGKKLTFHEINIWEVLKFWSLSRSP